MTKTTGSVQSLDARAAAVLTLCCVIWGVGLVMVKVANAGISPLMNAGLRSVFASLGLLALVALRGVPLLERDRTLWPGLFCGFIFSIEFLALYLGLTETTAARGVLFLHAAPFIAAAGEHVFVPGHRLSGVRVLGLIAAFAGLGLALSDNLGASGASTLTGDLLCLLGGIIWGIVSVIMKASALRTAPPEKSLLYQLGVSALLLPAASLMAGEPGIVALTPTVIGAFAYTVLLTVVFGYTIWFWMMRTYSAASLHAFTFLTPIFGAVAGHLILGEQLGTATLAGLVLVASGIYLVNRPARPR